MAIEDLTVEEVAQRWSGALAVFNRHGIDICCGGSKRVSEVAQLHGVGLGQLLTELSAAGVTTAKSTTREAQALKET